MPPLTYILDELAYIDEYLSACDVGDGRADVINSLQSMIKSAGTLTMTDAAKVATAIKGASSLVESDVKSLHATLQQQVSAGMVGAPRTQGGNTIQQSFTERMSCGAMLTENVWDYLMATNIQFDLKLQHIVDVFWKGGDDTRERICPCGHGVAGRCMPLQALAATSGPEAAVRCRPPYEAYVRFRPLICPVYDSLACFAVGLPSRYVRKFVWGNRPASAV